MLEGKAKELFWKWYILPKQRKLYKLNSLIGDNIESRIKLHFIVLSDSEKWGVYQDFADSLGYLISIEFYNYGDQWDFIITNTTTKVMIDSQKDYLTRQEARTEAIKKLNELINQSN